MSHRTRKHEIHIFVGEFINGWCNEPAVTRWSLRTELRISSATLTEVYSVLFPQLYGKCQGIISKDWARPALFQICYLCCLFVILVVLLLIVMLYVLFMCKCLLPPGVNPIAVDKYIDISITTQYSG
jgi:hypothetical protein